MYYLDGKSQTSSFRNIVKPSHNNKVSSKTTELLKLFIMKSNL